MARPMMGSYPNDPTDALADLTRWFNDPQHDYKILIQALYELGGFGLYLSFGDKQSNPMMADPAIIADSVYRLQAAMFANTQRFSNLQVPPWLQPMLTLALQTLLTWINHQTTAQQFTQTGQIPQFQMAAPPPAPAPAPPKVKGQQP